MKKILTYTLSGLLAVLITGMLFYRFDIFNHRSPNFQFIEVGILISVLFPVCLYKEKRDIFITSAILIFLHYVLLRPPNLQWMVRDIFYLGCIIAAVITYVFYIYPVVYKYKLVRMFALPFVLGIFYVAAFLLLALESYVFFGLHITGYLDLILLFLKYGAIIGFGLAIGFNFAEFIIKKYLDSK